MQQGAAQKDGKDKEEAKRLGGRKFQIQNKGDSNYGVQQNDL